MTGSAGCFALPRQQKMHGPEPGHDASTGLRRPLRSSSEAVGHGRLRRGGRLRALLGSDHDRADGPARCPAPGRTGLGKAPSRAWCAGAVRQCLRSGRPRRRARPCRLRQAGSGGHADAGPERRCPDGSVGSGRHGPPTPSFGHAHQRGTGPGRGCDPDEPADGHGAPHGRGHGNTDTHAGQAHRHSDDPGHGPAHVLAPSSPAWPAVSDRPSSARRLLPARPAAHWVLLSLGLLTLLVALLLQGFTEADVGGLRTTGGTGAAATVPGGGAVIYRGAEGLTSRGLPDRTVALTFGRRTGPPVDAPGPRRAAARARSRDLLRRRCPRCR